MSTNTHLGRRSFLGVSASVVAGASLAGVLSGASRRAGAEARFSVTRGIPDLPLHLEVSVPGVADGARASGQLFVVTPREVLSYALAPFEVRGGKAQVELTLVYPYEDRVPGEYTYHAQVEVADRRAVTAEPAVYAVRDIRWFS